MSIGFFRKLSIIVFLSTLVLSCDQMVASNAGTLSKVRTVTANNLKGPTPPKSSSQPFELAIEKISSEQFYAAQQHAKANKPLEKITDFKTVQEKLSGIVEFENQENYLGIKKINFRNGPAVKNEVDLSECSFLAYFPSEDVLLLECGHNMDVSYDLTTGKSTYEIGNPSQVTTSPSGKYRLNKIYEGQECFHHFIQKKKNGRYEKITELNDIFERKNGKWLCVVEKEFWSDDQTLHFGLVTQYKEGGNEYEFYIVKIIESNNLK